MKLKQWIGVIFIIAMTFVLSACEEAEYYFNDRVYSESELEEYIADLLEVENSDKDIEINIFEESE